MLIQNLARQDFVAERDLLTPRMIGRKGNDLAGRKTALGQDAEHLAAYVSGGADDGYLERHGGLLGDGEGVEPFHSP